MIQLRHVYDDEIPLWNASNPNLLIFIVIELSALNLLHCIEMACAVHVHDICGIQRAHGMLKNRTKYPLE